GAETNRLQLERTDRAQQTEPGRVVVRGDRRGHRAATVGEELDLVGFEDEIADREHEAARCDQYAAAGAFGTERADAAGTRDRPHLHRDDRVRGVDEVLVGGGLFARSRRGGGHGADGGNGNDG